MRTLLTEPETSFVCVCVQCTNEQHAHTRFRLTTQRAHARQHALRTELKYTLVHLFLGADAKTSAVFLCVRWREGCGWAGVPLGGSHACGQHVHPIDQWPGRSSVQQRLAGR